MTSARIPAHSHDGLTSECTSRGSSVVNRSWVVMLASAVIRWCDAHPKSAAGIAAVLFVMGY